MCCACLAKSDLSHEEESDCVCTIGLHKGYWVKNIAQSLAHFEAIFREKAVAENFLWGWEASRHQQGRPHHCMKPNDVLACIQGSGFTLSLLRTLHIARAARSRIEPPVFAVAKDICPRPPSFNLRSLFLDESAGSKQADLAGSGPCCSPTTCTLAGQPASCKLSAPSSAPLKMAAYGFQGR